MHDTLALEWFSFSRNVQFAFLIKKLFLGRDTELIFIAKLANKILAAHVSEESS